VEVHASPKSKYITPVTLHKSPTPPEKQTLAGGMQYSPDTGNRCCGLATHGDRINFRSGEGAVRGDEIQPPGSPGKWEGKEKERARQSPPSPGKSGVKNRRPLEQ